MKDTQVATLNAEPRIFLLSPVLHCVSMTSLVFLRSSFGYAFLRPKSFFFAFSWAFILYAVYAWIDGEAWAERRALLWFGVAAMALYWFHFTVTISREWCGTAQHDNDSGTLHIERLLRRSGVSTARRLDRQFRLWVEPGTVTSLVLILYLTRERHLSAWLSFTALCLWIKEVLNQWFSIRRQKRGRDITDDLSEAFDDERTTQIAEKQLPVASVRKSKTKRTRNAVAKE